MNRVNREAFINLRKNMMDIVISELLEKYINTEPVFTRDSDTSEGSYCIVFLICRCNRIKPDINKCFSNVL